MSVHPDLRPLVEGADLPVAERRNILNHVRDCAPCRAELAGHDPSLLFSCLTLEPIPDGLLDRVSARAGAAIDRERRHRRSRRALAWGSLAASFLVGGLFLAYAWSQRGSVPAAPTRAATSETAPAGFLGAAVPAGMIEILDSPGSADVVEISVGDVEVVMIFDEALKI